MEVFMRKFVAVVVMVFCQCAFSMSHDKHGSSIEMKQETLPLYDITEAIVPFNEVDEKDKCECAMHMFHETYGQLAEIGGGEWIYQFANDNYPSFVNYYRKWLFEHDLKEPVIGLLRESW